MVPSTRRTAAMADQTNVHLPWASWFEQVLQHTRGVGVQPTCGTGIEPATASLQNWCSTLELTVIEIAPSETMSGTYSTKPFRVA